MSFMYSDKAMRRDAQVISATASSFVCEDTRTVISECNCGRNHVHDAALRARRDPTRTLDLRRSFIRNIERRWRAVSRLVTQALTQQDVFGLAGANVTAIQFISMSSGRVNSFQSWIDTVLADVVLGLDRERWIGAYIDEAYRRGWKVANAQVGTNLPMNEDRATIITKLTISELQGVIEAFSQRAVRAFSDGLLSHLPPATIARSIRQAIDKVGIVRSRATVQTVIVRANAEASLDAFALAGVKHVGLLPETLPSPGRTHAIRDAAKARRTSAKRQRARPQLVEVLTAGDDEVCIICQDLADEGPYTIQEARGLLPAHPNCRCAFVPLDDARFAHDDNRTVDGDWNEGDHPRDDHGRFGEGGTHDAVKQYIKGEGDGNAFHLNPALREDKPMSENQRGVRRELDRQIDSAKPSTRDQVVYRAAPAGTYEKSNYGTAGAHRDRGFVSTSSNIHDVAGYAESGQNDVVYEIKVPKGSKFIETKQDSQGYKEQILPRNSVFTRNPRGDKVVKGVSVISLKYHGPRD